MPPFTGIAGVFYIESKELEIEGQLLPLGIGGIVASYDGYCEVLAVRDALPVPRLAGKTIEL